MSVSDIRGPRAQAANGGPTNAMASATAVRVGSITGTPSLASKFSQRSGARSCASENDAFRAKRFQPLAGAGKSIKEVSALLLQRDLGCQRWEGPEFLDAQPMARDRALGEGDHAEAQALRDGGANAGVVNADDRTAREGRSRIEARLRITGNDEGRGIVTPVNQRGDTLSRDGDVVGSDDFGGILPNSKAFDPKRRKRLENRVSNSPCDSFHAVRIDDDDRCGRRRGKSCHDRRCSRRAMSRTTGHSATR